MDSPVLLHYAQAVADRCSERYSARSAHPDIFLVMTYCSYCKEWAVIDIPANPAPVCLEHALEFWTGLLTYAREHSELSEPLETHATCAVCRELSEARARAMAAIDAAGPPPQHAAREPLRLASTRRTPNVARITASEWSGISRPMIRGQLA